MADIGKAYIQIIPSAEGIKGSLADMFEGEAKSAGEKAGGTLGSGLAKAAGTAAKVAAGAMATTTAAVGAIAKESVSAYADFEQLSGGIETLFGSAAPTVMKNAEQAFRTAGQSMNDYMDTSIQSAAALINSLEGDQAKAAELMDVSIIDMADNVNKMGTSMEGVQNAYRGFSRGNFTMLDNLALGFAGTKEGMNELLNKAKELSGVEYDIESYADIVQAIHVVQESMGVAGTTAKEGVETISGSISTLQGAWTNLIAGLGNDSADLDSLIGNVVDSASAVLDNLQPIIEKVLTGFSNFVEKAAPIIADALPGLIDSLLPSLLSAAEQLLMALASALPSLISTLLMQAPGIINTLIQDGFDLILELAEGMKDPSAIQSIIDAVMEIIDTIGLWIGEYAYVLIDSAVEIIITLVEALTDPGNISRFIETALFLIESLANGLIEALPKLAAAVPVIIMNLLTAFTDNIGQVIQTGVEIIVALIQGIVQATPELVSKMPEIISAIFSALIVAIPQLLVAGVQIVGELIKGVAQMAGQLIAKAPEMIMSFIKGILDLREKLRETGMQIIENIKNAISEKIQQAAEWGKDLIGNFIGGIKSKLGDLKSSVSNAAGIVKSYLGFSEPDEGPLSNFHTFAPDMVDLFAQGIYQSASTLQNAVGALAGDVRSAMPMMNAIQNGSGYSAAVAPAGFGNITIPVQVGKDRLCTAVVKADQINNYRNGGR